jgi:hypothetical protein
MRPEQALQQAAVELLGYAMPAPPAGPFWFAPDPGLPVAIRKGASEAEKKAARIHAAKIGGIKKSLGVRAGVPDIVLLKADGAFGLEFKSPDGITSTVQQHVHLTLSTIGFRTYIVRSLEDVRTALEAENVRLRASF